MSDETLDGEKGEAKALVNTNGGASVEGSVYTEGGDFVGRDLTLSRTDDEIIDIGQLEKRPYVIRVTEEGSVFGDVYTAGGHFIGRDLIIHNLEVKEIEHLRPEPCDPPCITPYQGLLSFGKGDADRFFGRQALIAEIVEQLHQTNFLTVIGASGSGKSSVVCAGVVPAILGWRTSIDNGKSLQPLPGAWQDIIITPTAQPLAQLAERLYSHDVESRNRFQAELRQNQLALTKALNQATLADGFARFLVIDQLEELFTLCTDATVRQAYVDNLVQIAQNPQSLLKVVLVLRADFYSHCLEYKELVHHIARRQVIVTQMDIEDLAEAILQPAANGKWKLQARLVDQMLIDAGSEPGALPLLSHALLETWNHRRQRIMTLSGYREAGGVDGAIAQTAENILASLDENEQLIARRLFIRLTGVLDQETPDTRRRVNFSEIGDAPATQHVQQQLIRARLITADQQGIQVAHEALIRNWPQLRHWLDADRQGIIIHRRLTNSSQMWMDNNRDRSFLYSGLRLVEAEQWVKGNSHHDSRPNSENLNHEERAFLEASILAEQQNKQNRRRSQIGVVVLLTILAMVSIGAALINQARTEAIVAQDNAIAAQATSDINASTASTREADAQIAGAEVATLKNSIQASQLAEASRAELQQDPELALILATTALSFSDQADTQARFYDAIFSNYRGVAYDYYTDVFSSVIFSPSGKQFLTTSDHGIATLWDYYGNELASLVETNEIKSGMIDSASNHILTISDNGTTKLWDFNGTEITSLGDNSDTISTAVFSPNGNHILSLDVNNTAKLWGIDGTQLASLNGHSDSINSVVFSPDGMRILTASADGTAKVWDLDGNELVTLVGHTSSVYAAIFNSDDTLLLTSSWDDTVKLWDNRGTELVSLDGLFGASFSPSGDHIYGRTSEGIQIWDLSGNEIVSIFHPARFFAWVVFSSTGNLVLTPSNDDIATVELRDLDQNELTILQGHADWVHSSVFNRKGDLVLTASEDGTAKLWDINGNELVSFNGHTKGVYSATFSQDENNIITISDDQTVRLWDLTGNELASLNMPETRVNSALLSPTGDRMITILADNTIKFWNVSGNHAISLDGHTDGVNSAIFNSTGDLILTISLDNSVKLWDLNGNELISLNGHQSPVYSAIFNPTSNFILTESERDGPKLWDLTGNERAFWGSAGMRSLMFSAKGDLVLGIDGDDTVKLWDSNGNALASLEELGRSISFAIFNPNSDRILTISQGDMVRLWDLAGNELSSFPLIEYSNVITWVTFDPTGNLILTADGSGTAQLWDLDGNQLTTFTGHEDWINTAVFNPDNDLIVTSSRDGTARLWDLSGNQLAIYGDHSDEVNSAVFNPTGDLVLTSSRDGSAKLWPVYPTLGSKTEIAWTRINRGFTEAECQQFFRDDLATCPRTKEELFAPLAQNLTAP